MRYIYPPRPLDTIAPTQLPAEEQRGCWFWQPKYDGDRCITVIDGGSVMFSNRRGKFHPNSKFRHLPPEVRTLDLPAGATYLDGELLTNDRIVFYDVLQYDGKYLFGCPQVEREALLRKICRDPQNLCDQKVAWSVCPHLWMTLRGDNDFLGNYQRLIENPLVEGLLLRRKDSTLDNYGGSEYDVKWQLRCRKNTKNYRF